MRFAVVMFMLAMVLVAHAEDYVAINSLDGRDVLSGVFYANAKGLPVKFMPVPGGNSDLFVLKVGADHSILLIQSADMPASGFVETGLKAKNNTIELYSSTDGGAANLDLAKRSGASSFIIVDSAYSDSALSVLPYAALTKSYVILANKGNIDQVKDIVKGKKVIIYGLVDKEVKDGLAPYSPQILGKGEDRYEDNVLIAGKAMSEFGIKSAIVTDGTFVEEGMAKGDLPVLFVGKLVPTPTYDFIKGSVRDGKLTSIMLLGNDLVVPVYDMREKIKNDLAAEGVNSTLAITVKFGQAIPGSTGVLALDTFAMPAYVPSLEIGDVSYNTQTKKLMVTVNNLGDGAAYYTMEVRVKVDGADYKVFSAADTLLVGRGEVGGSEYPLDLSGVTQGKVTASVLVKYGGSKYSLDQYAQGESNVTSVSYVDTSDVSVVAAKYDGVKQSVLVTIKNNGNSPAYVFPKLELVLSGTAANISGSGTRSVDAGSLFVEEFPMQLSQADLAANKKATVFIDYGARQGFLQKHNSYMVQLEEAAAPANGGGALPVLLIVGVLVVVVLIAGAAAFFLLGKPRK